MWSCQNIWRTPVLNVVLIDAYEVGLLQKRIKYSVVGLLIDTTL